MKRTFFGIYFVLVNLMDFGTLKSLNEDCLSIKSKLNIEVEKVKYCLYRLTCL